MSQLTIPDTAGMRPNPAQTNTDTWSSRPDRASRTPDFSYPLVSSISFSSTFPISLFLVHISTIIAEHKVMSSLSISPCHDQESIPSTAYTEYSIHRVQHTPSTVYTEYSIHRVLHHPNINCLPLAASLSSLGRPCCTQLSTPPQLRVIQ